ncbi:MAG TPA: hypothetical protein VMM57_05605 [Bacteroidota bacterium]|nr:hypothetical protein [Bacteroidota bacterium]
MARAEAKQPRRKAPSVGLPFSKTNYQIFGVAAVVILAGYVALAQSPWDGTMPLVVAPLLLVLGYCVIIPYGILHRKKAAPPAPPTTTLTSPGGKDQNLPQG